MSAEMLTNNKEVDNNALKESLKAIYCKCVQVANFGLEKRLYNVTFFIVIYKYNNNDFLDGRTSRTMFMLTYEYVIYVVSI